MPQMRPTVDIAKIQIPTGYEQLQREAASKRRIADAMLAQGLGPRQGMNNYAQLFGQLASSFVGKRLDKKASQLEGDMSQRLRQDYTDARGAFLADVEKDVKPADLVATYGSNPLLADDLKPYMEAMTTGLREREQLINFGGRAGVRQGDVAGSYENDPNKPVHVDAGGNMVLNPVAITAGSIQSGANVLDGPPVTSAPLPGFQGLASSMARAQQPQQPQQPQAVDAQDLMNLRGTMSEGQLGNYLRQGNIRVRVNSPEEIQQLGLPPGTQLELPDGTFGEVP